MVKRAEEIMPEWFLDVHREVSSAELVLEAQQLSFFVKGDLILQDVNLSFQSKRVTAIIGPSGSGKTTLLRCFNRMYELIPGSRLIGSILFKGNDVTNGYNVCHLRRQIGMVFQKPCVFPKSIFQNVTFGIQHVRPSRVDGFNILVEEKLRQVSLWDEVKDRLHKPASGLSMGQQQRLCIARTLALEPEILLLDEPTSSLDPKSTEAIEGLIEKLKAKHTVILVTHNLAQARRIADEVVFICKGRVCETGEALEFFERPCHEETREYIRLA